MPIIPLTNPAAIGEVCRAHHIRRPSIFGSAIRDDARPDSDVDLVAEFEPKHTPSYFELVVLSEELSPFFASRRVDLVTPGVLHRLIRDSVMHQAKVLYEG